jgi:predicted nucleic acid-binding protein
MGPRYFADTFYWIALIHPKDAWHRHVHAWAAGHASAQLVTTAEILAEVLTWFAARGPAGRALATTAVRAIRADASIQMLPPGIAEFDAALALYEARPDKSYSLTDCRSMLVLRALGISEVLTNDHHFTQEGFTILFP